VIGPPVANRISFVFSIGITPGGAASHQFSSHLTWAAFTINCLSSPQSIPRLFNIPHTHLASGRKEGEPYDSQHSASRATDLLNRKLLFDTVFASLPKDCLTSKYGVSLITSITSESFRLAAPYGSDSYSRYMAHFSLLAYIFLGQLPGLDVAY
jgi:hypothetical protein